MGFVDHVFITTSILSYKLNLSDVVVWYVGGRDLIDQLARRYPNKDKNDRPIDINDSAHKVSGVALAKGGVFFCFLSICANIASVLLPAVQDAAYEAEQERKRQEQQDLENQMEQYVATQLGSPSPGLKPVGFFFSLHLVSFL